MAEIEVKVGQAIEIGEEKRRMYIKEIFKRLDVTFIVLENEGHEQDKTEIYTKLQLRELMAEATPELFTEKLESIKI